MAWDNQPEESAFSFDRPHIRIFRRIGREYCGLLVVYFVLVLVENGYLARSRPFFTSSDNVHIQISITNSNLPNSPHPTYSAPPHYS